MYNPIRIAIEMWREEDAEGRKDTIEAIIGWACLFAIGFMLSGGVYV